MWKKSKKKAKTLFSSVRDVSCAKNLDFSTSGYSFFLHLRWHKACLKGNIFPQVVVLFMAPSVLLVLYLRLELGLEGHAREMKVSKGWDKIGHKMSHASGTTSKNACIIMSADAGTGYIEHTI